MKIAMRVMRLVGGLFLFAVGIVMTINANIGLAPWDVFHQGVAIKTNMTIGQVSIITGLILIIINTIFGERLGWGTVANMLLVGIFIDFLMQHGIIPIFDHILLRFLMLLSGIVVLSVASYFYMSAELGAGPRDGLMVVFKKRINKSVGLIRNTIESSALVLGYLLGGNVGVGTVVAALGIGTFVQIVFKIAHFNVSEVEHRFIDDDIRWIREKFSKVNKIDIETKPLE